MYNQHLPNLGRLTNDEIGAVMAFYRRVESLMDSHQTYNQVKLSEDSEEVEAFDNQKMFASFGVKVSAERALLDLRAAQYFRGDVNFLQYLRNWKQI